MSRFTNPVFENIWKDRYCKNGETYDENLHRVANFVGQTDYERTKFYQVMEQGLFFPGGRTMSNAAIGSSLTLNNCFVAPKIEDSLDAIFESVKLGAIVHQRGGGIGYDFSYLRPNGTPTSNDAIASGPVSFANVFNAQTATILQGNRRGANMGVLNVYHPDIEEFIHAKATDKEVLKHFNLSVMVDDAFLKAVEEDKEVELHWPVYDEQGRIERNPEKWKIVKSVKAKELWDEIMRTAYNNGEPGIFFYDNLNNDNNLWYEETITSTNPCSEYLSGIVYRNDGRKYGGACNLGSLMLHNFVERPFTPFAYLNTSKLVDTIKVSVRFLDNIIDINTYPDEVFENYQKTYRTIGLGYTGLADMLVMLGHKYNSQEARDVVNDVCNLIAMAAYNASMELAKEKGSFPAFDTEKFLRSGFLTKHQGYDWKALRDSIEQNGIRNAKLLSVAPTGTMSLVYGNNCSSGIEPIFSLSYDREIRMGGQDEKNIQVVTIRDHAYDIALKMGADTSDFVTALNISVDDHIKMLATIAKHVDMSVSKTINVPEDYPFEKCKDIYMQCWRSGIKGCTIFRPNELRQGIMHADNKRGKIVKCDNSLYGIKRKLITGCGSMHLMAWYNDEGNIMEVFVGRGSSGGCEKNLVSMARLISLSLRGGVALEDVIDQLESCGGCSAYQSRRVSKHDTSPGSSCSTAIALALRDIQKEIKERLNQNHRGKRREANLYEEVSPDTENTSAKCPECGAPLGFEGGCVICKSCGYSKCG